MVSYGCDLINDEVQITQTKLLFRIQSTPKFDQADIISELNFRAQYSLTRERTLQVKSGPRPVNNTISLLYGMVWYMVYMLWDGIVVVVWSSTCLKFLLKYPLL